MSDTIFSRISIFNVHLAVFVEGLHNYGRTILVPCCHHEDFFIFSIVLKKVGKYLLLDKTDNVFFLTKSIPGIFV